MKIEACMPRDTNDERIAPLRRPVKFYPTSGTMFYVGENGPVPTTYAYCDMEFADTILRELDEMAQARKASIAHIGIYNPRMARSKSGKPLGRVSNHAFGRAIDFKGWVIAGSLLKWEDMTSQTKAEIKGKMKEMLEQEGLKEEIVDEGGWLHIGYWL